MTPVSTTDTLSALEEPIFVTSISVAPPASTNTERHVIIHELATTEAQANETEEIPVVDSVAAEDNDDEDITKDNVQPEPEVISQIEPKQVSSPPREVNEPIASEILGHLSFKMNSWKKRTPILLWVK